VHGMELYVSTQNYMDGWMDEMVTLTLTQNSRDQDQSLFILTQCMQKLIIDLTHNNRVEKPNFQLFKKCNEKRSQKPTLLFGGVELSSKYKVRTNKSQKNGKGKVNEKSQFYARMKSILFVSEK